MAMAYNREQSRRVFVPITDELLDLFPKNHPNFERRNKIFVHGKVRDGKFVVDGTAHWQEW